MIRRDLTLSTVVRQNPEPVAVDVDQSVVMMSVEREKYYSLDGVGVRIWQLLAAPRSIAEVCDVLLDEYAIEADECRREVLEYLDRLAAEGLVVVVDESPGPVPRPAQG